MQKFQSLLSQAAQLKQQQLKQERKLFQSLPEFLKAGLTYSQKYKSLRMQNYLIKYFVAERLKRQGNQYYQTNQPVEALNKYQQALAIFRYIESKTNQNIKDDDLIYHQQKEFQQHLNIHNKLLNALYLNICSCLTKLNKKDDAIVSADEALKIQKTAKGHYKKAQSFLQYINRNNNDIKLGFYELNQAYQLSNDESIIAQMYKIKSDIDQQRTKQKEWFKFMFDKNKNESKKQQKELSQKKHENKQNSYEQHHIQQKTKASRQNQIESEFNQNNEDIYDFINSAKVAAKNDEQNLNIKQLQDKKDLTNTKIKQNSRTKQRLQKYVHMNKEWVKSYQFEFVQRHGKKIYQILKVYGYQDVSKEYEEIINKSLKEQSFEQYFKWLKEHPIQQIKKYIERYDLQRKWIEEQKWKVKEQSERKVERQKQESKGKRIYFIVALVILVLALIVSKNLRPVLYQGTKLQF